MWRDAHRHRIGGGIGSGVTPVSRCAEYFRDEHARRDYRNMRVKRTLPSRTTVVKHEGTTKGERIEHRREE
ncbi:unnamed protein product [Lasius platythorax]|uniref:Uncharacterized protein n=1 Tax=Lasius platythorax TaxID=488582 RepID=A0AAV2NMF2_9HYME